MELREIQQQQHEFVLSRKWERFDSTLVYMHLIEEISEIGSYLLYEKKYKVSGAGHKENINQQGLEREFAQAFNLFLQLTSSLGVDLQEAWIRERNINLERFDGETWRKLAEE